VVGHVTPVLVITLPADLIALYDSEKIVISVHLSSRARDSPSSKLYESLEGDGRWMTNRLPACSPG
jgi:hypothetical protein